MSEAENWGRLGSEMGSTQQELSDQSRGEKEVRWEIKVQELGRYLVSPSSGEDVACGWSPLGKRLIGRSLSWPSARAVPSRVLCNCSGFGFSPHTGNIISQHYLAGLMVA